MSHPTPCPLDDHRAETLGVIGGVLAVEHLDDSARLDAIREAYSRYRAVRDAANPPESVREHRAAQRAHYRREAAAAGQDAGEPTVVGIEGDDGTVTRWEV